MSTTSERARCEPARTAVRWKIFAVMLCLITINYVDRASLSIAMPLLASEFNISPVVQGLVLSSFFWTYAAMQVPGGLLADRFKPRVVIGAATVFWGAFQGLAAACTNAPALLLARLGLGAAEAPIFPAGGKLIGMWMSREERGRGATLLDGGAPLGAALGSLLIAGLISALGSWRSAFAIAGIATVLAGVAAWLYIRNTPREHRATNESEALHIEQSIARDIASEPPNLSGRSLDFLKSRSVWCMFFGWMCFNSVFYGLLTWMPNYLHAVQGFDIKKIGGSSFIIFFSGFVGEMVGGWIADRCVAAGFSQNRIMRTLFGIAAVIATVSVFSVAYQKNSTTVVALLASTLFFLRWCGLYWCIPSLIGSRNKVGFLGGLMNLGGNVGGVLVPIVVGFIVQYSHSYFLALMVFAGAGAGLFVCSCLIDYEEKLAV
ncbi:MFS transporter [Burkholderia glumae]|uniref:MFS transporter n=1 Tax=Burkholderia glumae TaxID=337 RepID=UPI002036FE4B|nr:MFS transporter [Burkholderia glumae]MCM2496104.1 MFS transporter [Burkholderia glumae]UVT00156.1 MFS transporter [Burkholderia glumae]